VHACCLRVWECCCVDVARARGRVLSRDEDGKSRCSASQGVFLLNTVLTVEQSKANSHARRGWEEFTAAVIDAINTKRSNVVFLLWGTPAQVGWTASVCCSAWVPSPQLCRSRGLCRRRGRASTRSGTAS
jgi:uracil DNA glycosylase